MVVNTFTISLFFHILFVIAWLFTLPIATMIGKAAEAATVKADKFKILGYASFNGKLSLISAVLVFFTGAMMTEISYSWAPDTGQFWLVTKQTIWLILIVLSIVLMRPLDTKMHKQMEEDADVEEVMSTFKNMKVRGHILTTFIIVNILLATLKPF